jgi:hypothetical protein
LLAKNSSCPSTSRTSSPIQPHICSCTVVHSCSKPSDCRTVAATIRTASTPRIAAQHSFWHPPLHSPDLTKGLATYSLLSCMATTLLNEIDTHTRAHLSAVDVGGKARSSVRTKCCVVSARRPSPLLHVRTYFMCGARGEYELVMHTRIPCDAVCM